MVPEKVLMGESKRGIGKSGELIPQLWVVEGLGRVTLQWLK